MTWVEDLLYGITTGTLSTLFGENALKNIVEPAGVETFIESAGNFMLLPQVVYLITAYLIIQVGFLVIFGRKD